MDVAQKGHSGLNRKAARTLVKIAKMHGVDKHTNTHVQAFCIYTRVLIHVACVYSRYSTRTTPSVQFLKPDHN